MPAVPTKPGFPRVHHRDGAPDRWYLMEAPRRTFAGDSGDLADVMGRGPTASRMGNAAWTVGPRGGRINCPGSNGDYASCGVAATDYPAFTASIRFEIAPNAATGGLFQWAANSPSNGDPFVLVQFDGANLRSYFNLNYRITTPIAAGTAHEYTVTADGSTWLVYLDGLPVGSYTGPWGYLRGAASTILLGNGYPQSLACRLDDFRLYRRVLSPREIARDVARPYWRLERPRRRVLPASDPGSPFRPYLFRSNAIVGAGVA